MWRDLSHLDVGGVPSLRAADPREQPGGVSRAAGVRRPVAPAETLTTARGHGAQGEPATGSWYLLETPVRSLHALRGVLATRPPRVSGAPESQAEKRLDLLHDLDRGWCDTEEDS